MPMDIANKLLNTLEEGSTFFYVGNDEVFECKLVKLNPSSDANVQFLFNSGPCNSLLHPHQIVYENRKNAINNLLDHLKMRANSIKARISSDLEEVKHIEKQIEKYSKENERF